ncbi:hypothetical protein CSC17_4258 [Klebsiella oxytoca]|nr:hypothetical protein CSC17_4258 [Klebsiella oxytoca]EUC84904.1 hypothetical protein HMPREF1570_5264 [Klebsiella oxytoca KA-2]EUC90386.1 hypothetical protein HMPREF1569_4797 [Klebsiella oxytoca OK-1]
MLTIIIPNNQKGIYIHWFCDTPHLFQLKKTVCSFLRCEKMPVIINRFKNGHFTDNVNN